MNRYAQQIIERFLSQTNRDFLYSLLADSLGGSDINSAYDTRCDGGQCRRLAVVAYLDEHLEQNMWHFTEVIKQQLAMSDPMPGSTLDDQMRCFNDQFLDDRQRFIATHVLGADYTAALYSVTDGLPTSRHGVAHHRQPANYILQQWQMNAGRLPAAREDVSGDYGGSGGTFVGVSEGGDSQVNRSWSTCGPTYAGVSGYGSSRGGLPSHSFARGSNSQMGYASGGGQLQTGIIFCDQRNIGTANHLEQYENTLYKKALNRGCVPTPFGVATEESDARLLSRRTFRANEAGVENGIPRYESRLYKRFYERNIDEGLRGAEKGCMIGGYDMDPTYRRLAQKQATRAYYNNPCVKSQSRLYEWDS
jgi:hypothetical protein